MVMPCDWECHSAQIVNSYSVLERRDLPTGICTVSYQRASGMQAGCCGFRDITRSTDTFGLDFMCGS